MADGRQCKITVVPKVSFLADHSDPAKNEFVFSYTIKISNDSDIAVQIVGRHWIITDSEHKVQEIKGVGVVGQQPLLKPGESFEYTSGASIPTPVGTMRGTYQMRAEDGQTFDATIPPFTLSVPRTLH